jgi:NAD(P)H-binding
LLANKKKHNNTIVVAQVQSCSLLMAADVTMPVPADCLCQVAVLACTAAMLCTCVADLAAFCAGAFTLEIDGGIGAYTAPRPALVLISSAGTERNAIIGDDSAARQADIPIVQLNPGGTLNWKYKGEQAVRASGLPYCVVRPTGLISEAEDGEDKEPYTVEFAQGDAISGRLSRADVAAVVSAALQRPYAADTTFEARRTQRRTIGGPATFVEDAKTAEFLKLSKGVRCRVSKIVCMKYCSRAFNREVRNGAQGALTCSPCSRTSISTS